MPSTLPTDTNAPHAIQTLAFVSLGCPKNLVDSEKMLGLLAQDGLIPIPPDGEDDPDAVVINTCGFLEASKDESVAEINQAIELKNQGRIKRVVVAGCLVQRHRAKLLQWCPGIDALIGVFDRDQIVTAVRGQTPTQQDVAIELPVFSSIAGNATIAAEHRQLQDDAGKGYFESDAARLRLTERHFAYLRVSEGCNQNCAFCTIPSIRGKMRSKPVDKILAEARELLADGAVELSLIGQDTTSYGKDIAPGSPPMAMGGVSPDLVGMLTALDKVAGEHAGQGNVWLRLMYAYPTDFTDAMIDAIARLRHVLPYIDIPLQHINDTVLDNMRRRTSRQLIETLLAKLRDRVPGMAIRTTFISGFPGETQAQHRELVEFVREFGFENMGVFGFSPEPGTPAARLHREGGAVPEDEIQRRVDELMQTQQDVAFERNAELAETEAEFDVLIDEDTGNEVEATPGVTEGGTLYEGRTYFQAPQIDGLTHVVSNQSLAPGERVRCRVVNFDGYDLIAVPVEELEKTTPLTILG